MNAEYFGSRNSVAIISKSLAIANNISIGDEFSLSVTEEWNEKRNKIDFKFEVIGIRDFYLRPELTYEYDLRFFENIIYVPNWIANYVNYHLISHSFWWGDTWGYSYPHFVLSDISYMNDFLDELHSKFPEGLIFNDFSSRFSSILHSTNSIVEIFNTFLIASIFASLIVMTLINHLIFNERRKEIGIYMALGEKKLKIFIQIIFESILISIISLTISLFIGNYISNHISTFMVRTEMNSFNEKQQQKGYLSVVTNLERMFGYQPLSSEELIQAYDVSLTFELITIFYLVLFTKIVLSNLIPMSAFFRINPKDVLL